MLRRGLSWLQDRVVTIARNFLLSVLASGPIPQHVGIVMDGNRRYARMNRKAIHEGHSDGFLALRRTLEICFRLGIQSVSTYAFSSENFKRSEEEVSAIMRLAEEKLLELCKYGNVLDEYGVRLNVVGRTELLPVSVQEVVRKAELMTCHNKRSILNVCMPYTSREEMAAAIGSCVDSASKHNHEDTSVSEEDIYSQLGLSLGGSPPLDILVRTSGAKRLSDFMLWQCVKDIHIQFSPAYWPDFGFLDFLVIILDYQRKALTKTLSL